MDISAVHSVFHHLSNLPVNLLGIQFPVPEPERSDAVSPIRLLESRMKRLQRTDRRRSSRELRQAVETDSADAGAGYPEKIPSGELEHGRTLTRFLGHTTKHLGMFGEYIHGLQDWQEQSPPARRRADRNLP